MAVIQSDRVAVGWNYVSQNNSQISSLYLEYEDNFRWFWFRLVSVYVGAESPF